MASTIKVDELRGSTGSTITVPTGQTLTLTDGLASASLPVVGVAKGGTNIASFAAGDLLYATGSTTLAKLTKGTAEQVLAMNSGATAPDWGSVDLTVLPTITVAKGGTNISSFTAGDILYATGATTLAKLAKGTGSQTLKMNAGATAPEWATVAAASSDFTKIAAYTATSGSTIDIDGDFSATYDVYRIIIRDWYMSSVWNPYMRVLVGGSEDSGSYYVKSIFRHYTDTTPSNSITAYGDSDSTTYWQISGGDTGSHVAGEGAVAGWIDIYKPLNTTQWKKINYAYNHESQTSTYQGQQGTLSYHNTNAISGIRLYSSAGTVSNFEATIYGIKS